MYNEKAHNSEHKEVKMNEHYKFENMPLPFCYAALEPYIDAQTMELHHDRHLQTYIDNLNSILGHYPRLQDWSLERLIMQSDTLPEQIAVAIKNNAGGIYNHFMYFDGLTDKYEYPKGGLRQMFDKYLGGYEGFVDIFTKAAMSVFGSGYAWLTIDRRFRPKIIITANQNTPLTENLYPLLNIDVWEHAYYLKHYNDRAAYISDWFSVANFAYAEARLSQILNIYK